MKKQHNIFKDTSFSKDELMKYLDSNLSPEERNIIEKKIASNDFSTDAIEGFEVTPSSIDSFNQLSDDFHANLTRKAKGPRWKFEHTFFLIVIIALSLYGVGHYFLPESEDKREAFNEMRRKEKEEIAKEEQIEIIKEQNIPPVVELSDGEIDSAESLPENKQLLSSNIIIESPIKVTLDSSSSNENQMEEKIQEAIDIKEQVELVPTDTIEVNKIEKKVIVSTTKTLYLSELLVVDYADVIDHQIIEKTSLQLTGLSADKESNSSSNEIDVVMHTKEIAYIDYLRKTQEKFRKNNFKAALKDYKLILEHFPNDINAHFYSGLCYYNINKLNKAKEHFNRTINHNYNVFHEEGNWYKALCLYELNETSACISLLNKIANSGGFYAEEANKLLDKI